LPPESPHAGLSDIGPSLTFGFLKTLPHTAKNVSLKF
jgi:hypothetical protein